VSEETTNKDPRWGEADRDKKAEAILRTVELSADVDAHVRQRVWLDVGCGSGGISATLAQYVDHVIGVDPESWDRWGQYQNDHSNLILRKASYGDLPTTIASESVDIVVCNQVYEHVDDPFELLRAINFALKPGGLCYFAGPNLLWPIEPHVAWPFVHWLPRRFAQQIMSLLGSRRPQDLDAWSWSYWKLAKAFRRSGFDFDNAVGKRLQAEMQRHTASFLGRLMITVASSSIASFAPILPGFIFILRKAKIADRS